RPPRPRGGGGVDATGPGPSTRDGRAGGGPACVGSVDPLAGRAAARRLGRVRRRAEAPGRGPARPRRHPLTAQRRPRDALRVLPRGGRARARPRVPPRRVACTPLVGRRPIVASPLGVRRFFSAWGLAVLASEALWVWLPAALFGALAWRATRARAASKT